MMTDDRVAALKARVCDAIDDRTDEIIDFAKDVQVGPELGHKEAGTARKVISLFEDLDLDVETGLAITGAHARAGSGNFVAVVLGELDALVNPNRSITDPETGTVCACDHNAQLANLVGTAFGLVGSGTMDDLNGAAELAAVPAEEYLDLGYRRGPPDVGDTEFPGGKQELTRRGYIDDRDAAAMIHADSDTSGRAIMSDSLTSGFIGEFVTCRGTGAHADMVPEKGINALNVAMLGMNVVYAQRERFRDKDHVRVYPIITRGDDDVSVVPAEVTMESYVRAISVEAVADANESVSRVPISGTMGAGGDVEIKGHPGYMPFRTSETIVAFCDENARDIAGPDAVTSGTPHLSGSTDMDDIMQLVPGIRPWTGGFEDAVHARDLRVVDEEMAYVILAKLTACTLVDLPTSPEAMAAVREAKAEKHSCEECPGAI